MRLAIGCVRTRRGAPGRGGILRGVADTGCTPDRCDGGPQQRARIACACCACPCCAYSVLCVPLLCIPVLRAFVLGVWCTCAAFSQIVRHPLVNVVDIAGVRFVGLGTCVWTVGTYFAKHPKMKEWWSAET